MIKNGRPYTDENGSVDSKLITQRTPKEIIEIVNWIKETLVPYAGESDFTSYGFKHDAEEKFRTYFTNNEFKDAMLFAGYYPIDPDELNWRYRARKKEIKDSNPNEFMKWLRITFGSGVESDYDKELKDAAYEFLFEDESMDKYLPTKATREEMVSYLEDIFACERAMYRFDILWDEYERLNNKK